NQVVRAGDTLIQLDPADYQARLDQARASAAEAEAAVETATRQIAQQRSTIAAMQAGIDQAQAEQTRAGADATRAASLAANGWTSKQANDLAIADSRKAAAAVTSAVAQKAAAEQQLAVLQAQAAQAVARAANMRAAVVLADVAPGTQVIAIAPTRERLFVIANLKETQLRHMRQGMKVRLTPDIDPDAAVDGRIDSLAPATGALFSLLPPENATGNFTKVVQRVPVKIVIDPDQAAASGWLRAGLSVTAEVDTRGADAERAGLFGAAAIRLARLVP
ncbi:MAG: HlyD family secretion protein, partial [Rhodospirillales bacterium]|nr:HlyD family secretion protein [Rhodospirillales bacterium]